MKAKDYIIKQIKDLIDLIPQLSIRYEYDEMCESHFIEVSPVTEFSCNEKYILKEKEISLNFILHYPFEILTFISEDDCVVLETPMIFKSEEKKYISIKKFNFENIIAGIFDDYYIDWKKSISFTTPNTLGLIANYKDIFDTNPHGKLHLEYIEKPQMPEIYTTQEVISQSEELAFDCDSTNVDYLLAA